MRKIDGAAPKIPKITFDIYRIPLQTMGAVKNCEKRERCKTVQRNEEWKTVMASKHVVPAAKEAMEKFKMETANEVGVNLKQGYNGDLTSKQAGSFGGQMVKKMIENYENGMKK